MIISQTFQRLFTIHPDACCLSDGEYFLEVNDQMVELLGYTREELTSKPFIEFVHPDDRNKTHEEAGVIVKDKFGTVFFENRYITKAGKTIWLSWKSVIENGKIYAIARDVSKAKTRS